MNEAWNPRSPPHQEYDLWCTENLVEMRRKKIVVLEANLNIILHKFRPGGGDSREDAVIELATTGHVEIVTFSVNTSIKCATTTKV